MQDWRSRRRWRIDPDWFDLAFALALTAFALASTPDVIGHTRLGGGLRQMDPLGLVLLVLQTFPVAFRRRNPPLVLAVTGCAVGIYSGLGFPGASGGVGVLIATYTVAAHTSRRAALISGLFVAAGLGLSLVNFAQHNIITLDTVVANYVIFATVWIFGDWVRVRRDYTAQLEARAASLEREREERARLAVAEERARIARELHDVVAHNVSVMVVQAAAARRVMDTDQAAACDALGSIEESGRSALNEMRRMLGVLRSEGRSEALEPQPGVGQVERLVAQVREAGLDVELAVQGWPRALPRGVDLTAYRIVQEALTNTIKHAGQARAWVTLTYAEEELQIDVRDDGRGAAAGLKGSGAGQGIIGMRERAMLYGGTFRVGPMVSGGWRVEAQLPLDEPAPPRPAGQPGASAAGAPVAAPPQHGTVAPTTFAVPADPSPLLASVRSGAPPAVEPLADVAIPSPEAGPVEAAAPAPRRSSRGAAGDASRGPRLGGSPDGTVNA